MAESTVILNGRTEYTAIAGGIVNVGLLVAKLVWGIEIGPDIVVGINAIFGSLLAVFIGNRMERTKEASDAAKDSSQKVEMNQPAPALLMAANAQSQQMGNIGREGTQTNTQTQSQTGSPAQPK